jgi:regulatory helix-turn-helix LysR family protein
MDLRRLRTFVTVAELGTVSKAALRLRIGQPALSRKREPTTALAELTQIMCVSVVKHMHKDTKGHGRGDHLARGAAPEVEP